LIIYFGRLILEFFPQTFVRRLFDEGKGERKSWWDTLLWFLFVPFFWTVLPAVVATLLLAPIMGLSLTVKIDEWYRLGILIGLILLGCFLIHYFSVLIVHVMETDNAQE
jgi:hypothetical protein